MYQPVSLKIFRNWVNTLDWIFRKQKATRLRLWEINSALSGTKLYFCAAKQPKRPWLWRGISSIAMLVNHFSRDSVSNYICSSESIANRIRSAIADTCDSGANFVQCLRIQRVWKSRVFGEGSPQLSKGTKSRRAKIWAIENTMESNKFHLRHVCTISISIWRFINQM